MMNFDKKQIEKELINLFSIQEYSGQPEQHAHIDKTNVENNRTNTAGIKYIIEAFDHADSTIHSLTDEILFYYEQINAAFHSTQIIAQCHTTREATLAMLQSITEAIKGQFAYYWGNLADQFSLLNNDQSPKTLLIPYEGNHQSSSCITRFFEKNKSELKKLAETDGTVATAMIDYQPAENSDYAGYGNVIAVNINIAQSDFKQQGTLFFIRNSEQRPFQAIEMNLASTLVQNGVAILTNIIYAQKLHQTYLQSIASLVRAMEAKDSYTSGHSGRVAKLASSLAVLIGLPEEQILHIEWAGLLHDIGKIGIDDKILRKNGKLTHEEFEQIQTHPIKSYNVLEPIDALRHILSAVRYHHEHYDGSGYPDGLAGKSIPLPARILQVADIWDALTSKRPYRDAIPHEIAIEIMKAEAGTTTDPDLLNYFITLINT